MTDEEIIRILLVEDNPADADLVKEILSEGHFAITHVETLASLVQALEKRTFDLVLLDLFLPDCQGLQAVHKTLGLAPAVPVVVMSGLNDEQIALDAVQDGAQDYLVKGIVEPALLTRSIRYAIERKRLHDRLSQAEKLAALGQLVSGIAHELNNPLTSVIGYAELALKTGDPDEKLKSYLETIHVEGKRAQMIVRNLIAFSTRRKPRRAEIDINELLDKTIELRSEELTSKNVSVRREYGDLPRVLANAEQLQEAFLNIVVNAEQALSEAKDEPTMLVRSELDEGAGNRWVAVTISDNGPGITPKHLGRVFDPFFTTKPIGKGAGLGLSVTHGIVLEHGGAICVVSNPGGGATFVVKLPA